MSRHLVTTLALVAMLASPAGAANPSALPDATPVPLPTHPRLRVAPAPAQTPRRPGYMDFNADGPRQVGNGPSAPWRYAASGPATRARHGAVASVSAIASRVGLDTLRAGGNAVDAAIAVAFALAVVYPVAGNLGGGGFMVIRLANGRASALDYRETAPGRASRTMYLDISGNLTDKSLVGPLSAGVPGTVAGLEAAHKAHGRLSWRRLVTPAIALAERGFPVDETLAGAFKNSRDVLQRFDETRHVFMASGHFPRRGEVLRQPALAVTLQRIATGGAKGFYQGPTARAIASDQAATGGLITLADLAGYRATWRSPIGFSYRGYRVLSMPPPSSGGVTLGEMLHMLEPYDLRAAGWHSPQQLHWLIESARRAYADRNAYLGDPDFVPNQPVARLLSPAYARARGADIAIDRATPKAGLQPGLAADREKTQTTHFSVVDAWGNAVSNTYTLNNNFGSGVVARGTGVLLNDEMDDFAAKPGTPNLFGLVQGERNAIAPHKRPLSSMSPAIVLDPAGKLFLVVGSPGGSTIITTVLQVISNMVDFGMPLARAIASPRVHHQGQPDVLYVEPDGLPLDTRAELVRMGHMIERRDVLGDVMGIKRMPDGSLEAYADPRRGGGALGY